MNQQIINSIKNDIYQYIHTNIPARIIDFNHIEMTATVQIIAKLKVRGIEFVPKYIYRVPVGHNRTKIFGERNPLKKDDIVFLSFSEIDLEKILITGLPESILGDEKFSLNDAVITTCISLKNQKMPENNKDDWCLFNFETGHKIIFKENGEYEIYGKRILLNADEDITLKSKTLNINTTERIDITTKIININSTSNIEIETPIINALKSQINASGLKVKQLISDTISAIKSAVIKGIDFSSHKHGNVSNGEGETGEPK